MRDDRTSRAITWLLASEEPAVRFFAKRDLLDDDAAADLSRITEGGNFRQLLAGQRADGGFGVHPYRKWMGAHWRLIFLVELGAPRGEPRAVAAADTVLAWLTSAQRRSKIRVAEGRVRRCASQEGNALAVCSRPGLEDDPRVKLLAESLIEWQWPDGGWNCDLRADGHRSSFHESLSPMWGLHEYWRATGDVETRRSADRTAELFLEHRLFRTHGTGEPIHPSWLALHYPPYWHYDILQALLVLSRMGRVKDPRTTDALEVLRSRRLEDGRWRSGGRWWRPPGSSEHSVEVVDWDRSGPNEMITLNALRVLKGAGE